MKELNYEFVSAKLIAECLKVPTPTVVKILRELNVSRITKTKEGHSRTIDKRETVLIWGGSTGVGSNAIQLARYAGYRVIATSSQHNFHYLKKLGAAAVVDRNSKNAVDDLIKVIGDNPLAGRLLLATAPLNQLLKSLHLPKVLSVLYLPLLVSLLG
jgi:D-arabinose 1-dehydrogenase-like Zn-dependent alcohol dehydrogenase